MSVQIHINGESADEAVKELSALAAHFNPTVTEAPKAEKPSRSTKKTEKPAKEEKPVKQEVPEEDQSTEDETDSENDEADSDAPDEDIPSAADLRAKAQEIAKADKKKQPLIKAFMDELGVKNLSSVPEDKRSAFMAKLEKL